MADGASPTVLRSLETLFRVGTIAGLPDGPLLERFLDGPDEVAEGAFAALVDRHGPMVRRVCRQVLGDPHDAEDAAQATFLVLARKARSIRRADSVASWLHGVAGRVSARARADAARRRERERLVAERGAWRVEDGEPPRTWPELHEELGRLPEKFRLPIVLCHLEGLSHAQAAERLRCPVRTIQSRLARGRARLRSRLSRRGVGPAAALLAAALAPDPSEAAVPDPWKQATVKAAARQAAGGASAASVSARVAALSQGALRAMLFKQLKSAAAVAIAIVLGAVACGLGVASRSATTAAPPEAPDSRYRVTLAGGTTIEMVAVSSVPSGPKTWWKPDGTPLDEAPGVVDPAHERIDTPDRILRVVLIRVGGEPEDGTLKWLPTDISDYWGGRPTKDGRRVPGLEYYVASFARDRATCGVRARVAAGPWKTEASHDGGGGFSTIQGPLKFYFGKARAYEGGTAIAVAQNIVGRDSRVVAVDRDGREHPAAYSSGAGGEILSLLDVEFRSLTPDQVREYRVQSRPFEVAEIRDIALQQRPAR
jgi:RNA polymerase sigma factor (sigma-70 family)